MTEHDHDQDQRALLWTMQQPKVARANLSAGQANYPDRESRIDRALEKRSELMCLLLHSRVTTARVLAYALNVSMPRVQANVREWIRKGLLKREYLPAADMRVLMLTPEGGRDAARERQYAGRVETSPSRIGNSRLVHTLLTQVASIDRALSCWPDTCPMLHEIGYKNEPIVGERLGPERMTNGEFKRVPIYGDSLVGDDVIEVEITSKAPDRIATKIDAGITNLNDPETVPNCWVWYCPTGARANAVHSALDAVIKKRRDRGEQVDDWADRIVIEPIDHLWPIIGRG
ncbi:hypothetical protein [Salinisphaera orenii]|uniref:hypothetical protein n=1 Tax=Salinisphaera orenii TaxID=856731 RepID=UPI000DBE737A